MVAPPGAPHASKQEIVMTREPKRLPGEANPKPGTVNNPDWVAGGRGHDYGIARGIFALLDWRKRRRPRNGRQT
jgi:hypothetical protein